MLGIKPSLLFGKASITTTPAELLLQPPKSLSFWVTWMMSSHSEKQRPLGAEMWHLPWTWELSVH